MPIDSNVTKYAESLFDHRVSEEIRPAYVNRLRELRAKCQSSAQLPFSGVDAQRLIKVETQFAKEAAVAQVECLAAALTKRGLSFDDEAFRKGLDDTKKLLERHSQQATRNVLAEFTHRGGPPDRDMKRALEQDVDAEMRRIHDSVLAWLKVKLRESVVVASAKPLQPVKARDDDYEFARLAIEEARKSVSEQDGRKHPKVGAVVVKNGQVLSVAHRGEEPTNHAEFVALEKKLTDEAVAGATVYTTLEPCTTRHHPKIPCAARLIERKVARVVMGMLDPDPRITGRGMRSLRSANIAIGVFPPDLMSEVEELNREFTRYCEQQSQPAQNPTRQEMVSSDGDIKVELNKLTELVEQGKASAALSQSVLRQKRIEDCLIEHRRAGTPVGLIDTYDELTNDEKADLLDSVLLRIKGRKPKVNKYRGQKAAT